MAMTKKEQQVMADLKTDLAMARALAWPNFPCPDQLPPAAWDKVQHGWTMNAYSANVSEVWRKGSIHYTQANLHGGSRGPCKMWATEAEAYQALYHALARQYGTVMAKVLAGCFPTAEQEQQNKQEVAS